MALENGVDSIEHGAKMDAETIRLYKERGAFLCTTISPALPYALFDLSVSGATEKDQYNGKIVFDGIIESAKTALANDIPVGLGNDVGCPYITQYDFWRELTGLPCTPPPCATPSWQGWGTRPVPLPRARAQTLSSCAATRWRT